MAQTMVQDSVESLGGRWQCLLHLDRKFDCPYRVESVVGSTRVMTRSFFAIDVRQESTRNCALSRGAVLVEIDYDSVYRKPVNLVSKCRHQSFT